MSLSRSQTHYYTNRLYKFLEEGHSFEFRKSNFYHGSIDWKEDNSAHVALNPRSKVISTLIHEFLHHYHKNWCESKVVDMERRLINALSDRQIRNIIKRFAAAL